MSLYSESPLERATCGGGGGMTWCFLPELFTNAMACHREDNQRLFNTSARNVSSGKISHRQYSPTTCLQMQPFLCDSEPRSTCNTSVEGICMRNNIVFMPCSTQLFQIWGRVTLFWPLERFVSSHLEETEGYTIGDQLRSSHLNTILLDYLASRRRIMF